MNEGPSGPRLFCPACGGKLITWPTYCKPERRVMFHWWGWLLILFFWKRWGRCRAEGRHLHQRCKSCGFNWLCRPVDASIR